MMTIHQPPPTPAVTGSDTRPHAIVIGAGFGGLAAAVRLTARGYRVTVIDKLDRIGGRAYVHEQDGFRFDAGPTIITAPFIFEALWELHGERMDDHVTLKPLEPYYTLRWDDGRTFRCWSDADRMREEIAAFDAGDIAGYEDFLVESEKCFRTGFLRMIDEPFHSFGRMLAQMPHLIARRADRSVHALVSKYVRNENVRQSLSFHPLFIGGNPMRTSGVMSLISFLERKYGVHYAMGGTGALARGIADLAERHGTTYRLDTEVDEIVVRDGAARGVRLKGGETIEADCVVSNAEAGWTYTHLLRNHARKRWTDRKVARMKYSMSLIVWYFGTNRRYEDIGHHTIMMGPRYKGLITDIFDRKVLADDFSLYLYRPTASDPSLAPEGCDAFYVLAPVPNLDGDTDWTTMAEPYRQRIQDYLEGSVMPGLSDAIVTSKLTTPLDFRDRLLSTKGAAFGMEPTIFQLAWFRPHNISEEIADLYLVGAGTHPGAGLPGVVSSAAILDKLVPHAAQRA
ncbi:phytoene desaturase family protein [Roseitalea porphyridii]|uniref:Phytoene dehydrogenase n=1 Tax=Roseitalea porphyridii TaxID=1852022 RepID=A0A4P6V382_9HYPH|nr:phytoene desaturase family protein [Roseitalea porphyridii]QBK31214.1 phytoene desaturase [Roseitalea porphyridii]